MAGARRVSAVRPLKPTSYSGNILYTLFVSSMNCTRCSFLHIEPLTSAINITIILQLSFVVTLDTVQQNHTVGSL